MNDHQQQSIACIESLIFVTRGGSRTTAASKMVLFVIIVNGFQPVIKLAKIDCCKC